MLTPRLNVKGADPEDLADAAVWITARVVALAKREESAKARIKSAERIWGKRRLGWGMGMTKA